MWKSYRYQFAVRTLVEIQYSSLCCVELMLPRGLFTVRLENVILDVIRRRNNIWYVICREMPLDAFVQCTWGKCHSIFCTSWKCHSIRCASWKCHLTHCTSGKCNSICYTLRKQYSIRCWSGKCHLIRCMSEKCHLIHCMSWKCHLTHCMSWKCHLIHCTSGKCNSIRCALGRNVIRYVIRRGNSICYVFLRGKCHLIRCTSGKCHLICWMSGKCYSIRSTKEKMSFETEYVGKMSSVEALWEWVCPTFKYALCILFCRASLSTTRLVGVPGQGSHPSSWSACPPTIPRRPSWSSPSTLRPM